MWGAQVVQRAHKGAEPIVQLLQVGQLELLLEPGTITREKQGNEPSTLDLVLGILNIAPWIVWCKVIDKFHRSDHLLIEVEIQLDQGDTIKELPIRKNFKRANLEAIANSSKWLQVPIDLGTAQDIDDYTDYLIRFIQNLISTTVLQSKPLSYSQPWWTVAILKAIYQERQAQRY